MEGNESMTVNNPGHQEKQNTATEAVEYKVGVVTTPYLNYRNAPRVTNNNVIGNLKEDEQVKILTRLNDVWTKILVAGEERFVMSEFIKEA